MAGETHLVCVVSNRAVAECATAREAVIICGVTWILVEVGRSCACALNKKVIRHPHFSHCGRVGISSW